METSDKNLLKSLGFLRLALLTLVLINVLLPAIDLLLVADSPGERGLWNILASVIAPVMAPLLTVVLLFEYIMSRVRAADAEGELRAHFTRIGRIELAVMLATLAFWIPYFIELMS